MPIKRWTITNHGDSNPATRKYVFPQNPLSMTSPFPEKSVTAQSTPRGRALLWEGGTQPHPWEFSGPVLHKDHFDALAHWVYDIRRRLVIEDHYGRIIDVYFTNFDVIPKRRVGYYYSHDYTVSALVLAMRYGTAEVEDPTQLGYFS